MVLRVNVELLDGTPDGTRRAVVHQRQARAVAIPHAKIARMADFPELSRPGVYFLLGSLRAGPTVYVGQTDSLQDRLKTHYLRAQWHELIAATSDGDWLNIAHARVLEARCYQRCLQSRYFILNSQVPKESQISGHDHQDVEEFMEHLVILTQCLGYDFLATAPDAKSESSPILPAKTWTRPAGSPPNLTSLFHGTEAVKGDSPFRPDSTRQQSHDEARFPIICTIANGRVEATMHAFPGRFVLKAGSRLRQTAPSSIKSRKSNRYMIELDRKEMLKQGQIKPASGGFATVVDIEFRTPTAASKLVLGVTSNGWFDWVNATGQPLDIYRYLLKR